MTTAATGKENQIVITLMGSDHPGLLNTLAKTITDHSCNIVDSRLSVLGGSLAAIMMISGSWDMIAKLENALKSSAKELELNMSIKHLGSRATPNDLIPYRVQVVAMDHPGIVHEVASFFSDQQINIESMETDSYAAPHTGTQMFTLTMTVSIPSSLQLATVRDDFYEFCDDQNLDAMIEPVRLNM